MGFDDYGKTIERVCSLAGGRKPTPDEIGRAVEKRFLEVRAEHGREVAFANFTAAEDRRIEREHQLIRRCAEEVRRQRLALAHPPQLVRAKAHVSATNNLTPAQVGELGLEVGRNIVAIRRAEAAGKLPPRTKVADWLRAEFRKWSAASGIALHPDQLEIQVQAVMEVAYPNQPIDQATAEPVSASILAGQSRRGGGSGPKVIDLRTGRVVTGAELLKRDVAMET
jgi:hypothetical protein